MSGVTQFGIDEDNLDYIIEKIKFDKKVILSGIHIYLGTRFLDYKQIVENTENIINFFIKANTNYKLDMDILDIGGEIGINYFKGETPVDMEKLQKEMQNILNQFCDKYPEVDLILESGRFIVADSGTYVTKCIDIKVSQGTNWIILEGGTNHFFANSQAILFKHNYKILEVIYNTKFDMLVRKSISFDDILSFSPFKKLNY